jgi:membrane protease subunit HflK
VAVDRVQSVTIGWQEDGNQAMPAGQVLTGDHNLVNVQATLFYKVKADELVDYVAAGDRVEGLLVRAAEAALAEWTASRTVDEVLLHGKMDLGPALAAGTRARVKPYRLGVQVDDARVTLVAPPEEVKFAFDEVARAQTSIVTQRNRAEQEAEAALRAAEADAFRVEQTAAGQARSRTVLAEREAGRFLERLRQYQAGRRSNPAYLRQIWEEERGRIFARLKENGQLGLLDHHLGGGGLDLNIAPPTPRKP